MISYKYIYIYIFQPSFPSFPIQFPREFHGNSQAIAIASEPQPEESSGLGDDADEAMAQSKSWMFDHEKHGDFLHPPYVSCKRTI